MKFACCVRLRTAGVIIGYVGVVSSLFIAVLLRLTVQSIVDYQGQSEPDNNYLIGYTERDQSCFFRTANFCFELKQFFQFGLFFMILSAIDYALVIVGCATKNHWYFLPFLLSKGFLLCCTLLHNVYYVITLSVRTLPNWLEETIRFLICLIMIFIWCLIFALNRRYRNERKTRKWSNSLASQKTKVHYEMEDA